MSDIHYSQILPALFEGVGLILSPCILPILPITLAASLDGGKKRPIGIVAGFVGVFTLFALLSRQLLAWLHIDSEIIRNVAIILLFVFGVIMLSKKLSDKLLGATQGLANFGQNLTARWNSGNGFMSGFAIGALIGLIWAPCAGPFMAAALVQIIQAQTSLDTALTVLMFALGAGLPMLAIALTGRKIMSRLGFLKTHSYGVRRALGLVIIAAALLIYSGADVQLLASSAGVPQAASGGEEGALAKSYPAPEIDGVRDWINSPPLTIKNLRGHVVLIDFWTYSCINCVRTLPYITAWDMKYRDKGLLIIGMHAPEFDFEKKLANVQAAVAKYGIKYPVALDSNLVTWGNFKNRYWPAHYLIDKDGRVVYTHFGEGEYDVTENEIRKLLGLNPTMAITANAVSSDAQTPETYLGYARTENFVSKEAIIKDAATRYSFPKMLDTDNWALEGAWAIGASNIAARSANAKLRFNFDARKVFVVLGAPKGSTVKVHILLNGAPVDSQSAGMDVTDGAINVDHQGLYEIISQSKPQEGVMELQVEQPGLEAYAFTFGE